MSDNNNIKPGSEGNENANKPPIIFSRNPANPNNKVDERAELPPTREISSHVDELVITTTDDNEWVKEITARERSSHVDELVITTTDDEWVKKITARERSSHVDKSAGPPITSERSGHNRPKP